MTTIKDLKFLITGGTAGLGKALVENLTTAGAQVATFSRNPKRVDELSQLVPNAAVFEGDIAKKDDIYKIAATAFTALGSVDVLINNASTLGPSKLELLLDTECEQFADALQANLLGPFRLIKAVMPSMIAKKRGLIINISSDAAVNAYANWGAYGVSKAALDHLTRIFNAELKAHGITSVAIDPGDMNTALHAQALPNADTSGLRDPNWAALAIIRLINEQWLTGLNDSGELSLLADRIQL